MKDIQHLDTTVLLDLLAIHTAEYTDMMNNNIRNEAFENCKATISLLQSVINARKQNPENTSVSEGEIKFTNE